MSTTGFDFLFIYFFPHLTDIIQKQNVVTALKEWVLSTTFEMLDVVKAVDVGENTGQ